MVLPSHMVAVPAFPDREEAPLRVCAIVERRDGGARLVHLRSNWQADVYLGAVVDPVRQCREWLELWVQASPGQAGAGGASPDRATNASADAAWKRLSTCLGRLDAERRIGGVWERRHPVPVFLDPESGSAIVPGEGEDAGAWSLCRDDGVLEAAGRGPYAESDRRYLWRAALGDGSPLLSAEGACEGVISWAEALPGHDRLVALNPSCGLMLVRRLAPVSMESYIGWLTDGRLTRPPAPRTERLMAGSGTGSDADELVDDAGFVAGVGGTAGRLAEVLYLKLRLIASAIETTRDAVHALDRPLLTATPASYGVEMAGPSVGLPYAWTARVVLEDAGDASELERTQGHPRRFVVRGGGGVSVYRPESSSEALSTTGRVRVKRIVRPSEGTAALEGAVWSDEPLRPGAGTVAIMTLGAGADRLTLHAHLRADEALGPGELAFVSLPMAESGARGPALSAMEGVEFTEAPLTLLSAMSSPADLYSLAVLALRTLIAGSGEGLGDAVDAALTLARDLGEAPDPALPIGARVEAVVAGDERWLDRLGPQKLVDQGLSYDEASGAIPERLWWGLIGSVARMFPGMGPDSFCASMAVPPEARLSSVFDGPLSELCEQVRRVRGLLAVDWRTCEEIAAILDRQLARLDVDEASGARAGGTG